MKDALNDMWRSVATFAPKLVAFLLILIIGLIVAKLEQLSIPVDRGVSGDLRSGVLIAV